MVSVVYGRDALNVIAEGGTFSVDLLAEAFYGVSKQVTQSLWNLLNASACPW
jgi:hypothetical protein